MGLLSFPFAKKHHLFRLNELLLCSFWTLGLLTGSFLGLQLPDTLSSLMHMAVSEPVSIVGMVVAVLFPFFFSVIALLLSKPVFFVPIAFFKAFLYAFTMLCVFRFYGDSAWLVWRLLLFSDSFMICVLLWFWLRNLQSDGEAVISDILFCSLVAVTLLFIDFSVVSPFLVTIFQHF